MTKTMTAPGVEAIKHALLNDVDSAWHGGQRWYTEKAVHEALALAALSVATAPAQGDDRVKALEDENRRLREALQSAEVLQVAELQTALEDALVTIRALLAPVHTPDKSQ